MLIILTTCMGSGEWGEGGVVEKEGVSVKWAGHNIYNLFRVSLFHSDETFHVYACTGNAFFQIRPIKKPVMFYKNDHKKIIFITKCNEKNFLKRITLKKIVCKSQKW